MKGTIIYNEPHWFVSYKENNREKLLLISKKSVDYLKSFKDMSGSYIYNNLETEFQIEKIFYLEEATYYASIITTITWQDIFNEAEKSGMNIKDYLMYNYKTPTKK